MLSVKLCLLLVFCCYSFTSAGELVFECTTDGERCIIPFTYAGVPNHMCTYEHNALGLGLPWCVTSATPEGKLKISLCTICEAPSICYLRGDHLPPQTWKLDCPPGCMNISKRLWTSKEALVDHYSVDSFVCAAAIRERQVKDAVGGTVLVTKLGAKNFKTTNRGWKDPDEETKFAPVITVSGVQDVPRPQMIFSNTKDIRFCDGTSEPEILVKNQKNVVAVTLDAKKNILYWSDVESMEIVRANLSAGEKNPVQVMTTLHVKRPDGIAFDWIHNLLFWTDADMHTVSVATDLGKHEKTLITRPSSYIPRVVAVDPKRGYMYVTDWGTDPKIEKCHMTGSDSCVTVVGHNIIWPNGLTIDIENDVMYWADGRLNTISVANTDGHYRRELIASNEIVKHPYSIALFNQRLYWTDWSHHGIVSIDKDSGGDVHLHVMDLNRPTAIAIYGEEMQPRYQDHCRGTACKYLCLPTPSGSRCACPDRYVATARDSSDCKERAHFSDGEGVLAKSMLQTEFTYDVRATFDEEEKKEKEEL